MTLPSSRPLLSSLALAISLTVAAGTAAPVFATSTAGIHSQGQASGEERWTITMKDADIREFVEQVASITGETFVVDPRVKGQVSVISSTPLSLSEVYQLFLSVMNTHGFTVITQDEQSRIVPSSEAKAEGNFGRAAPDNLETRLIQVQHNAAAELIPIIRPLVPQYGHLAAVVSANAIIISDRRANIARIEQLIREVDQSNARDYSVITLQHAWVMDAAEVLNNSLNRGQAKGTSNVQVIADSRTNRLILLGPDQARAKLAALARSLDTPSARSANTRVIRLRHNDAKALAETLGDITEQLKQGSSEGSNQQKLLVRADESLNALIILAEPDLVATIEDIVRQLDVPRAQVLVEAAIVEVAGDITDALGVQWAIDARGDKGGLGGVNFGNTGISVGTVISAIANDKIPDNLSLPDGAIIGIGSDNFGALITALSANSKSNLLSTPSLLTLDNQKAEILVGQNVPFQTGSYTTDAAGSSNPFTTIERKDIGVNLKVTPHLNEGRTLRLEVEQEISSIAPTTTLSSQAVDLVTNKRSIKTTILAEDGQVIVLGGLIQDDVVTSDSKVPLLGDIPIIGRLFRSTRDQHVKRNLMVFLRPSLVRDGAGLAALSDKKYRDIQIINQGNSERAPNILPSQPQQLFDGRNNVPSIDLRQPSQAPQSQHTPAAQPQAVPSPEPVYAGHGQGGDSLANSRDDSESSHEIDSTRYSIALVEGRGEAYMQALIKQHPTQPLHLKRSQRNGQDWFTVLYGDYPQAELAELAKRDLPANLPNQRSKVVPI